MPRGVKAGKFQREIFEFLHEGGLLTLAFLLSGGSSRGMFQALRAYRESEREARVLRSVLALKQRRLISFKEENGETVIRLTRDGKNLSLRYKLEKMQLPRGNRWDKKWRLILFDIPEHHGKGRRALSQKLKDVGALQLQRSVFVYPFECRNEVDFITEFFQVSPYVRYVEAITIEGEDNLRKYFKI